MSEAPVISPSTIRENVDSDVLYEIVNGEYREIEPKGAYESTLASYLVSLINAVVVPKRMGLAASEVLFLLREEPELQRRPDVAFVSYDRWPEQPDAPGDTWDIVPDLAVEIDEKISDYFAAGVRQVWVFYPRSRRTYVFSSPTETVVFESGDTVPGGDVLPGFELRIDDLFVPLTKPAAQP